MMRTQDRALLEGGELLLLGLMPRASNYTFLGEVGEGARRALVVYKPRAGEMPLWDFPDGTLGLREVAASVVAEYLGWPSIPPTVYRDGPHGPGAVQLFVQSDPRQHYFSLKETCLDAFAPVAAFDALVNNADRKSGHCLQGADGRIWLVDHGVCFSVEPKLRTVIWDFAGLSIPEPLCQGLERAAGDLRGGPLRERLLELLDAPEVDATAMRAEALATTRRYPEPTSGRPYPWPPV